MVLLNEACTVCILPMTWTNSLRIQIHFLLSCRIKEYKSWSLRHSALQRKFSARLFLSNSSFSHNIEYHRRCKKLPELWRLLLESVQVKASKFQGLSLIIFVPFLILKVNKKWPDLTSFDRALLPNLRKVNWERSLTDTMMYSYNYTKRYFWKTVMKALMFKICHFGPAYFHRPLCF